MFILLTADSSSLLWFGFGFWKECGKESGSGSEYIGRASEQEGSRQDLASTCVLCPCAHSVLFRKTDQTEKETRGNQSQYSDWRYRWKQLDIYTNYVFHLEQVWKDGEWKSFQSWTELCQDTRNVSGAELKSRNTQKSSEGIGKHRKTAEDIGRHGKSSEAAENVGRCGKMSEASEHVAGDREDFWKAHVTDQVMSRYVTQFFIQFKSLFVAF